MVAYPSEIRVTDIVKWLEKRRDTRHRTTLFLGARTGGLFRSKTLYATLQYFSHRTFNNMSRIEQFSECYYVLQQKGFSESDIDTILIASLQGSQVSETDILLAELVKADIFDTIITTNVDDLLTRAFIQVGMRQPYDFQVSIPQKSTEELIYTRSKYPSLIIKTFGDLALGEYSLIKDHRYLETHEKLKEFLVSTLQSDVFMLGYDALWDRMIGAIFPSEGKELYYVDESPAQSDLLCALQHRRGKNLVGDQGSYDYIIQALHWHFVGEKSVYDQLIEEKEAKLPDSIAPPPSSIRSLTSRLPPPQPSTTQEPPPVLSIYEKEQRKRVFIGYSQKDRRHFQQLQTHLARYEREKLLDVWDDTKIAAGTKWHEEIQKTLNVTRIAILLVSADFLASGFIDENILPPLLQSAEAGGAIILSVILGHCVFEDTPLAQFQAFNSLSKPLGTMKFNDRQKAWADLVRYVITLLKDT